MHLRFVINRFCDFNEKRMVAGVAIIALVSQQSMKETRVCSQVVLQVSRWTWLTEAQGFRGGLVVMEADVTKMIWSWIDFHGGVNLNL